MIFLLIYITCSHLFCKQKRSLWQMFSEPSSWEIRIRMGHIVVNWEDFKGIPLYPISWKFRYLSKKLHQVFLLIFPTSVFNSIQHLTLQKIFKIQQEMLKMSHIQQRWGLIAASKIYHGYINYCVYPINYSLLLVKYIIWEWTTIFTEIVKEEWRKRH